MATETRTINEAYLDLVRELPLRPLKSEEDLTRAITMLDRLMDRGASGRSEDEKDYMLVMGSLVEEYEDIHWPMPSELEERELLRLHHEDWLARNPESVEGSASSESPRGVGFTQESLMTIPEKINRWMEENRINQVELSRLSGVATSKISQILSGKQGPTILQVDPLSRAMNVSLDWLYDDNANWPPLPRSGRGVMLSPAQEKLLEEAKFLCDGDETLRLAFMRLRGVPSAFVGLPSTHFDAVRSSVETPLKPERVILGDRERASAPTKRRSG